MKITHLTPLLYSNYIGGGERLVDLSIKAIKISSSLMNTTNISQEVITIGDKYDARIINGVPYLSLPADDRMSDPWGKTSYKMIDMLLDSDIIHIHNIFTKFGLYTLMQAKYIGKVVVGSDYAGGNNNLMNHIDGLILISSFADKFNTTEYNGLKKIIIGPVDTAKFNPNGRKQKRKVGSLVAVSRILPHKGIDVVIEALPDNVELRIIGKVHDKRYYEDLKKLSKGKNVKFLHDINDDESLVLEYLKADAFIQCSTIIDMYGNLHPKSELMGYSAMEAMSCGLPPIVSNCCSFPEIIADKETGFLFNNKQDLSLLLEELHNGSFNLEEISRNAMQRIYENFSLEKIGVSLLSFYSEVLKKRFIKL